MRIFSLVPRYAQEDVYVENMYKRYKNLASLTIFGYSRKSDTMNLTEIYEVYETIEKVVILTQISHPSPIID